MSSSFEKSVKAKYVEHILIATHAGEAGIAEVFRAINNRLRDTSWTTIFKALIVVHYMMREGEKDVTLRYLRRNPRLIALSHYSDAQIQGKNIRNYSNYLNERARTYGDVRTDYVRDGEGRLRKLSVDKGLLREVECVQLQIKALLKCKFLDDEVDNEITLLAFRLLISDLLELFHVVNEGVINVLESILMVLARTEHYFEMSRYDAERALRIYKVFTTQTAEVVEFLQAARRVEVSTRLQIPNIKHAPTSLTSSLEEYLNDPDFDVNRRQYLAQKEGKEPGGAASQPAAGKTAPAQNGPTPAQTGTAQTTAAPRETSGIAPDLIDFFESIETEQTPMFADQQVPVQQQVPQMTGAPQMMNPYGQQMYAAQPPMPQMPTQQTGGFPMGYQQPNTNPFPQQQPAPAQPVQQHFTGTGFGGYTPQDQHMPVVPSIPQQYMPQQQQQSILPEIPASMVQQQPQHFQSPPPPAGLQVPSLTGHATNPFRQSMLMSTSTGGGPQNFGSSQPPPMPGQQKSTNPFARSISSASPSTLTASTTGGAAIGRSATTASTNPFARTAVTNTSPQPTGGSGLSVPGGTNPFRASMLVQQQQAQQQAQMQGNFSGQTGTMGGLETLETMPIFPRTNNTGTPPPGAWQ
ncbi:ANTH domain-containing protein [Tricharina praecox]|uniref:ANTH domain-containing protein n=1 Tax=Tricharina praecox TaxID=43433 RepID=UPI0022209CD5|nr:ANTH domain-containing protein [Tricharina praecox]KAI5858421.1 ANTH domain-containing protein [Tricharina praecox]